MVASAEAARPVVLLVDDEPDVLESLERLVSRGMNVQIRTAGNGEAALSELDDGRVDLIVSDYKMPGMDGVQLLHWASRTHPKVPRVMLTAFADDETVRQALAESFVDRLIPKTVAPLDLLGELKQLLASA